MDEWETVPTQRICTFAHCDVRPWT